MLVQAGVVVLELYAEAPRPAGHPVGPAPPGRAGARREYISLTVNSHFRASLASLERFGHARRPERVSPDEPGGSSPRKEPSEPSLTKRPALLLVASLTPIERITWQGWDVPHLWPLCTRRVKPAALGCAARSDLREVTEFKPGKFRPKFGGASYIEFEFGSAPDARYLLLPGLAADQDVIVLLSDKPGRWRGGQNVRWLKSPSADASIDLQRLIHWSGRPLSGIRLQFTCPGELALTGTPRLLR